MILNILENNIFAQRMSLLVIDLSKAVLYLLIIIIMAHL